MLKCETGPRCFSLHIRDPARGDRRMGFRLRGHDDRLLCLDGQRLWGLKLSSKRLPLALTLSPQAGRGNRFWRVICT